MKQCKTCGQHKDVSQFGVRSDSKDRLQYKCKACRSVGTPTWESNHKSRQQRHYKHRYGIDRAEYDAMLACQDGCCAICKSNAPGREGAKHFCVDHDHVTGRVRGLLCDKCNRGIGFLQDSVRNLQSAIRYLQGETNERSVESCTNPLDCHCG